MIDQGDFEKKQILFYFPANGDKMSFRNDNMLITDGDGKVKYQSTCYRIFLVFVAGDTVITTGLLQRANKFGFSICLMNRNLKVYRFIPARMEGNTVLRKNQYQYIEYHLARVIVANKILNQRTALNKIRGKTPEMKEAISKLDEHILKLKDDKLSLNEIMGYRRIGSTMLFPTDIFERYVEWEKTQSKVRLCECVFRYWLYITF
jgi:CRISPR-associated protein Cas1